MQPRTSILASHARFCSRAALIRDLNENRKSKPEGGRGDLPNTFRLTLTPIVRISGWACLALALMGMGCHSLSGPGSASFASVTIQKHSVEEIAAATAQVFGADGYQGGKSGQGQMVFQKEASRATTMSRDGLVAAQSGARTMNRVRVEIVPLADGAYRLQCQAYMVTGAGDSFFEDEVPLANIRSGPYQSLLNKVAKQLK